MSHTKVQRRSHLHNYRLTIGILLILSRYTQSHPEVNTSSSLHNLTAVSDRQTEERPSTISAIAMQSNNITNSLEISTGILPTQTPTIITITPSVSSTTVITIAATNPNTTIASSTAPPNSTTNQAIENANKPNRAITRPPADANCFGHARLVHQPVYSGYDKLKKCCPEGFNYQGKDKCVPENVPFAATFVDAVFFDSCIEDNEYNIIKLETGYGNPCVGLEAFMYNIDEGDMLYVLQNGSLLRIDVNFEAYDVFDAYCLDMDRETKLLNAVVCNQTMDNFAHVSKAQSYLYAICKYLAFNQLSLNASVLINKHLSVIGMLVSVPCLLVTAGLYFYIPQLRNLHGKSLACHSLCLATGFLLLSIAQIRGTVTQGIGYVIQYFILACFFWLAVMCVDICSHVW